MGDHDWARELVGQWVVHLPTQVVDRVERFCDGEEEVAVSTLTGEPVRGPVIEMAGGATFVAEEAGDFRALADNERQLYAAVQAFVADIALECARMAGAVRVGPDLAVPLIASALRAQARAIDRARHA